MKLIFFSFTSIKIVILPVSYQLLWQTVASGWLCQQQYSYQPTARADTLQFRGFLPPFWLNDKRRTSTSQQHNRPGWECDGLGHNKMDEHYQHEGRVRRTRTTTWRTGTTTWRTRTTTRGTSAQNLLPEHLGRPPPLYAAHVWSPSTGTYCEIHGHFFGITVTCEK